MQGTSLLSTPGQFREVSFFSFFSGRFITAIIVNPPERRLAKRTSVHWSISFILKIIYHFLLAWSNIYHGNTLLAKIIGAVQYINKNMDIWTKIFPMISKKKDSNPAWFVLLTWPLSITIVQNVSLADKKLYLTDCKRQQLKAWMDQSWTFWYKVTFYFPIILFRKKSYQEKVSHQRSIYLKNRPAL